MIRYKKLKRLDCNKMTVEKIERMYLNEYRKTIK